jgi:hypothetical protein
MFLLVRIPARTPPVRSKINAHGPRLHAGTPETPAQYKLPIAEILMYRS